MKPVIELVIFVGFICIIAVLTLIYQEQKKLVLEAEEFTTFIYDNFKNEPDNEEGF